MSAPQTLAVAWLDYVGSDWLAIYVDGERVYEGHPPNFDDGLAYLGLNAETLTFPSERLANLPRMTGMPRSLAAVR